MRIQKLYGMLAASALLFASSCQQEELVGDNSLDKVTFHVSLQNGVATRTVSDGKQIQELYYAVFNEDGKLILDENDKGIRKTQITLGEQLALDVHLTKGHKYHAAFWAQSTFEDSSNPYKLYTANGAMSVKIDYEKFKNNDDKFDAFYDNIQDIEVGQDKPVQLTRPFAQVNAGVPIEEYTTAVAHGIEITKSKVEIENIPCVMNLSTGVVNKDTIHDLVLLYNDILDSEIITIEKVDYKSLSMNYILAEEEESSLHKMVFTLSDGDEKKVVSVMDGLLHVPVKRNWRTNILGNLLSGESTFNISVNLDLFGSETKYISIWDGKTKTAPKEENGTYIITNAAEFAYFDEESLTKNVDLRVNVDLNGYPFNGFLLGAENVVFNGNGHTISKVNLGKNPGNAEKASGLFINSSEKQTSLVIKDLILSGVTADESAEYASALVPYTENNVTIENVTVMNSIIKAKNKAGALVGSALGATVTIKNCEVRNTVIEATESYAGAVIGYTSQNTTLENVKLIGDITVTAPVFRGGLIGCVAGSADIVIANCDNLNDAYINTAEDFTGSVMIDGEYKYQHTEQ